MIESAPLQSSRIFPVEVLRMTDMRFLSELNSSVCISLNWRGSSSSRHYKIKLLSRSFLTNS